MNYAIWGTGNLSDIVTSTILDKNVCCYIDNYKQKKKNRGKPVYSLEEFLNSEFCKRKIIIATNSYDSVNKQLSKSHFVENKHFFDGRNIVIESYYDEYTWRNESFKFNDKQRYLKKYFSKEFLESYITNYKSLNPLDPRLKGIETDFNKIQLINYEYQRYCQ